MTSSVDAIRLGEAAAEAAGYRSPDTSLLMKAS